MSGAIIPPHNFRDILAMTKMPLGVCAETCMNKQRGKVDCNAANVKMGEQKKALEKSPLIAVLAYDFVAIEFASRVVSGCAEAARNLLVEPDAD